MNPKKALKLLFIINPASGAKSKTDWETTIRNYFNNSDHTIDFFLLKDENCEHLIKDLFKTFKPDYAIAVGGDGTVSLLAKLLLGSAIALGILPAGSANGMAKELGISEDPEAALNYIINGEVKCSDVIQINKDEICLHLSDLGLNAQLVKYFEESNLRGMIGYAKMIAKVLVRKELMNVVINTKDQEIKRDAFMVVLANASKYGTGALVNPTGNLHDGLFEVVIIRKFPILQFFKMLFQFKRIDAKKVEIFHSTSVTISTKRKVHFQVDGQYVGKLNHVEAKILPSQLNLIVSSKGSS